MKAWEGHASRDGADVTGDKPIFNGADLAAKPGDGRRQAEFLGAEPSHDFLRIF